MSGIIAGLVLLAVSSPSFSQTMWREAPRWRCSQEPFLAACGGRYRNRCEVAEPRKLETLVFDFDQKVVFQDSDLGKSYVPITARTSDTRRQISTILFGPNGNIVMQYSGGQGVTLSVPPGGGTADLAFYTCEPAPAE